MGRLLHGGLDRAAISILPSHAPSTRMNALRFVPASTITIGRFNDNNWMIANYRFVRVKTESFNMMVVSADRMPKAAISAYIMGSKRSLMPF